MYIIRDIMYCKPGKVRPLVDKFRKLATMSDRMGVGAMRVMTDISAERFWMVVSEVEVASVEAFAEASRKSMEQKEFQEVMQGYHDLVDSGRREIYNLET